MNGMKFMKKWHLAVSLIFLASIAITGCNHNTVTEIGVSDDSVKYDNATEPSVSDDKAKYDYVPADDIDLQLNVIYENADIWQVSDEQVGDFCESRDFKNYGYAIADLDEDGYLEVIKSGWAGSGHFYTNSIYEVTETGELVAFDMDAFRQLDSEPSMLAYDGLLGYRNKDGELCFVMEDNLTDGVKPADKHVYQVVFKDNKASVKRICYYKVNYYDKDGTTYKNQNYYDADDNEIYMYEFYQCVREYYEGMTRERGQLSWFRTISFEDIKASYDDSQNFKLTDFDYKMLRDYIVDGALMGLYTDQACEVDVTGDGYVDICIGVTQGSGIVSSGIVLYDVYNQKFYELNDRMKYDYFITEVKDDIIHVRRLGRQSTNNDIDITGKLQFSNGELKFAAL